MMKHYFQTLGALLASITINAQTGINTPMPSAALDVVSKGNTNTTKAFEINNSNTTEMVTVLDNGNLGINTSAPGQKLVVTDALNTNVYNGIVSVLSNDKTTGVGIGNNGIQAIGSITNNTLNINGKGSGNLILQNSSVSTGRVGINTGAPASKFNMMNGQMIISAGDNPAIPLNNGWHDIAAPANTAEGVILRLVNTSPVAAGNTSILGFNSYNGGGATWGIGTRQLSANFSDSKFFIGWSNGGNYLERTVIDNTGKMGINTSAPTQQLDVNGNVRFRNVPDNNNMLSTDKVMVLQDDGTAKKVPVSSLQSPEKFALDNIYSITASNVFDRNIAGIYTNPSTLINDVNIQMSQTITIPANSSAMLVINYSVPIGMADNGNGANSFSCANNGLAYYGIRFLKDGVEMPAGSRKYSFPSDGLNTAKVSTISSAYTEIITNNAPSDLTITYSLNGYLEIFPSTISNPCNVRFNMFSTSGQNYNWGKANMNIQHFKKPL
ncbi:hypothetical protein [Chryseobacterium sp. OSA05B]|uniref:hypothetical protein n=1 Tax=Chryseobacterium sp. OSA05B TaxID=2862650 RepID=UPI001CBF910F|nr:hypothetical protein [Chryseobacterium sp. OSA05B]